MDKSDEWWVPYILLWRFLWVQVWRTKAHLAHPPDRCFPSNEFGMRNAECVASICSHISILIQLWKGNGKPAAAFGQAPFAVQKWRCPLIGRSRTATGWRGREEGGVSTAKWWSKLIQCFSCFKAFRLVNADIQERPARPSTRQNFKPGDWTCQVLNVEVLKAEGTNLKFRVWKVWYLFYVFYSSETPRVISSLLKQSMFESWLRSRLWWPRITIWVGMESNSQFLKNGKPLVFEKWNILKPCCMHMCRTKMTI